MNAADIARALGGTKSGDGWKAKCPAHNDKNPSLSIRDGGDDRALVRCHAGCPQAAVIDALRGKGLWPEARDDAPRHPTFRHPEHGPAAATWAYHDTSGKVIAHVARFDYRDADGGRAKTFLPYVPDGRGWKAGAPKAPRPLFKLPALLARPEAPVLVVEGEKKAEAAARLFPDHVATTTMNGAKSPATADWTPLKDRVVTIWPDHDRPGRDYAEEVTKLALAAGARSVTTVAVPDDFPVKWDLADPPPEGWDAGRLRGLLDAAAPTPKTPPVGGRLVVQRASDVTTKPVSWLWPGRLPVGKLVVIAGDPGLGKSQLALRIAATVSKGGAWPVDGTRAPVGSTLILSAEDDPGDTIVPRLKAAGADLNKIHVSPGLVERGGAPAGMTLEKHVAEIERALLGMGDARLLILDPPSAFLGRTDSHNNAEVRGLLAPVVDMAARLGVTVLLVTHLNKSSQGLAVHRATGSIAFVATSRASFVVAKDDKDPERRLFVPSKNNLARDVGGLAFRVQDNGDGTPVLVFESQPVFTTADEALNPARDPRPRDEAKEWLSAYLAGGPVRGSEAIEDGAALGHAEKTLRRAADELGVEKVKQAGAIHGGWWWRLPIAERDSDADGDQLPRGEDGQDGQLGQSGKSGHLDQVGQLRRWPHPQHDHKNCLRGTFPPGGGTQPKGDDEPVTEEIIL